jgi:anti-sigma factor RsiW
VKALRAHSHACDRARAWVSLELDGELSQLERSLLDSHLAGCAACRAFKIDAVGVTAELRAAPLARLDRPITLPSRRRIAVRPLEAAAAVLAAAIGLGSVAGAVHFTLNNAQSARAATINSDRLVIAQKSFQRERIILGKKPGPSGVNGKTRFPESMG